MLNGFNIVDNNESVRKIPPFENSVVTWESSPQLVDDAQLYIENHLTPMNSLRPDFGVGKWLVGRMGQIKPLLRENSDLRLLQAVLACECDDASVVKIARKYGFMRQPTMLGYDKHSRIWVGESLNEWYALIGTVKLIDQVLKFQKHPTHESRFELRRLMDELERTDGFLCRARLPRPQSANHGDRVVMAIYARMLAEESGDAIEAAGQISRLVTVLLSAECVLKIPTNLLNIRITVNPIAFAGIAYLTLLRVHSGERARSRICKVCGLTFLLNHGRREYCSESCRRQAHRLRKASENKE